MIFAKTPFTSEKVKKIFMYALLVHSIYSRMCSVLHRGKMREEAREDDLNRKKNPDVSRNCSREFCIIVVGTSYVKDPRQRTRSKWRPTGAARISVTARAALLARKPGDPPTATLIPLSACMQSPTRSRTSPRAPRTARGSRRIARLSGGHGHVRN